VDVVNLTTADGSERVYVNIAGAGFDSAVNETANRMRTRMPGTAKYVVALGKTLRRFEPASFTLRVDDQEPQVMEAMMVVVANGRSYGGGMRVNPEGSISDGKLEVCIVAAMGKGEFLRSFPKVFRGTHVNHPKVTMLSGKRVQLDADRETRVYADGEPAGSLPATFEVRPLALRIVRP
jgi:diacylglycerol kinase (ATP)